MQMLSPEMGQAVEVFAGIKAAPVMFLSAVLLAGFIAAGMMVFAAFARTFKEGQAMITPFYLVVMVPIVFLQVPGVQFSPSTAVVPVVNLVLMMRAALGGTLELLPVAITLASSLGAITLALTAAAWILKIEEIATGAYSGNLLKFVRSRLFAGGRSRTIRTKSKIDK
jgi:sodium transport system permease protein